MAALAESISRLLLSKSSWSQPDDRLISFFVSKLRSSPSVNRAHPIQPGLLKAVAESAGGDRDAAALVEMLCRLAGDRRVCFSAEALMVRARSNADPGIHALDHAPMMDSPDKITASRLAEEHETTVRMSSEQRELLLQHVATRDKQFSHHPADVCIAASPKGRTE